MELLSKILGAGGAKSDPSSLSSADLDLPHELWQTIVRELDFVHATLFVLRPAHGPPFPALAPPAVFPLRNYSGHELSCGGLDRFLFLNFCWHKNSHLLPTLHAGFLFRQDISTMKRTHI